MDEHNDVFRPLVWPLSLNYTQAELNRSYKDLFAMFLLSFFPFFITFLQFVVSLLVVLIIKII